eukprot:jgi/Astpho2/1302/Aster-x0994
MAALASTEPHSGTATPTAGAVKPIFWAAALLAAGDCRRETAWPAEARAKCWCGKSKNKPWCDNSHAKKALDRPFTDKQ